MTTAFFSRSTVTDESRAITTLVAAFMNDPAVRWMYPDSIQYLIHFPDFVRALGGKAFETETADFAKGFTGAALWLPPDVQPDQMEIENVLQHSVDDRMMPEVVSIMEQMASSHPEEPHWYLPFMGVEPNWHRRGVGTALMRRALQRCDQERMPAYLENTNPQNQPFYEQFGFRAIGRIQAGTSPVITPMLRRAG